MPDRAFERLYRRHVTDVYRFASAMLSNPADAEDVVQTTFLNAYRAFERGQRPDQPRSWLIAIANNVCRQRFRQQSRRPNEVELDDDLTAAPLEEERVSAEDIRRALSELAFNQRAALVMRELEGRSYAEIAAILGLSHAAVETLIFRARRALREQLEGGLTCSEAERAISLQLDGMLPLRERGSLRAHLRACPDCRSLAKRARGQRSALRGLGALPLPATLATAAAGGSGAAAVGAGAGAGGLVLKIAAVTAAVGVAGGSVAGYEEVHHATVRHHRRVAAPAVVHARAQTRPAPTRPVTTRPVAGVSSAPVRRAVGRQKPKAHTRHSVVTTPAVVVDTPVTTSAPHGEPALASASRADHGKGAARGRQHAPPGQAAKVDTTSASTSTPTETNHCKNGQGASSSSHGNGHGKAQGHASSSACLPAQTGQPPIDTTSTSGGSGPPSHSGGGHGSHP
jgi:RNA polymerase sigma factor (sigma-70 family)